MKSDYCCLNSKTFEIIDNKNYIAVDCKLANIISMLNKKGYFIDMFSTAKISKPYIISDLIHNLIKEKILDINKYKEKIIKIIKYDDVECTIIAFKKNYKFDNLPNGYKKIDNRLFYYLSVLKNENDFSFKTIVELDNELNNSINDLATWVLNLPSIK